MDGPRSPTSLVTAQLKSRRWKIVSFCSCADIQQRSNERMVVLLETRSTALHGFEKLFFLDGMKPFKNSRIYGSAVFPQTRPSFFHGVEKWFRLIVSQPCRNIQVCGWATLPNIPCHRPAFFAALKTDFVLMWCRLSTLFKWTDGRAPPNTAQLISRCWRLFLSGRYESFQKHSNLWLGCAPPNTAQFLSQCWRTIWSRCKTFKLMAGPRSQTSPVTAQLISRRWKIVSFWRCADFQQRSNELMVMLPLTRSRAFHGVENFPHQDGTKRFKNIWTYGWAVLPQTPPSFVHGVEKFFRVDVTQPFKHIQVDGWAALFNVPCHGPAEFPALKNRFVLMLCRPSTTFKWTDVCARAFPQTRSRAFPGVEKLFRLDSMKLLKNIRTYGWAVLPQTRPSSVHGVEVFICMDVLQP